MASGFFLPDNSKLYLMAKEGILSQMSRVLFLESQSYNDDVHAATSIVFEMEKGSVNKIVWFSNLSRIVDLLHYEINQNTKTIESLNRKTDGIDKSLQNITECIFVLKEAIDKLERKQKKNYYKLIDVLSLEDVDGDPMED